ncbi:MAG: hypothetical protein KF708_03410 [Pirellulales bacterium]|nr:hypothetical protein [Pirellulales bacterium]
MLRQLAPRAVAFLALGLTSSAASTWHVAAEDVRILFDVPDKIECHDVTPEKCAATHPHLKVIEAKFRVSASVAAGTEAEVVDFTYMISSPKLRLKILDFLPNTTLESRYTDDRIVVADIIEESDAKSIDAQVGYSIFSLNAVKNQLSRKTEQNQYERIAPKALVLASGTMNRGHGVFFKLRPSNAASLEGSKEFSFLAIVPRAWRADWCTFVCTARASKKSIVGNAVCNAGVCKADVGLYLLGDREGSKLSDRLCALQQENDGLLAKHFAAETARAMQELQECPSALQLVGRFDEVFQDLAKRAYYTKPIDKKLEEARQSVQLVEEDLGRLSGA